jgi:hypothetical protein
VSAIGEYRGASRRAQELRAEASGATGAERERLLDLAEEQARWAAEAWQDARDECRRDDYYDALEREDVGDDAD